MKNIKIYLLSEELIRPSSSTPDHLRHYKLAFLDQTQPPFFIPFVMFYPKPHNHPLSNFEQSERIKKSLSHALTIFYPLAGRIKDCCYVDCNDDGALFVQAEADCELSYLLDDHTPEDNNRFFPLPLDAAHTQPLAVQLTFFKCGGSAVFFGMSHNVCDGGALFKFIKTWAAISRGETQIEMPRFDLSSLFPPKNNIPEYGARTGIQKENVVAKKFVFDATALAGIRDKCTAGNSQPPSRMVALSAFIWSRFVQSTQAEKGGKKLYTLIHAVDFLARLSPPVKESYFGNTSQPVMTMATTDKDEEYWMIANRINEGIKKVDENYMKKLQESDGQLGSMEEEVEVVTFGITSWCRFPIYDADFGWGRPVSVGSVRFPYKNIVVLLDTESGDGIEAWINLREEDMAKLEADDELMSSVSSLVRA